MNIINKKILASLLVCLVVCAFLFAFPAFADNTVIVIGGTVGQQAQADTIGAQSALNTVSAINSTGAMIVSGSSAPVSSVSSANTASSGSVIVLPSGSVQAVSIESAQQTQAQTSAASSPVVVIEQSSASQTIVTGLALDGLADALLDAINQIRAANGLSTLRYSLDLQTAADARARESVQNFSHTRPDGSGCETAVTVDYYVVGENLIQVTNEFATASIIADTWLNSPSHRNNMLLPSFTQMAVGIYVHNDTTYVSAIFLG